MNKAPEPELQVLFDGFGDPTGSGSSDELAGRGSTTRTRRGLAALARRSPRPGLPVARPTELRNLSAGSMSPRLSYSSSDSSVHAGNGTSHNNHALPPPISLPVPMLHTLHGADELVDVPIHVLSRKFGTRKPARLAVGDGLLLKEPSRSESHTLLFDAVQRDLVAQRLASCKPPHSQAWHSSNDCVHPSSDSSDDGWQRSEPPPMPSNGCCCCETHGDGGCACRLCCLVVEIDGCAASASCFETALRTIDTVMIFARARPLELFIFGLLMPLFLAIRLQHWLRVEGQVYHQKWRGATCEIEALCITNITLYMHGDYLRNDHPNDGIYYVLQPSWSSIVTPLPVEHSAESLPRLWSELPRQPQSPWRGTVVDELMRGRSATCEGPIGYTLTETVAHCQRDLSWTLPRIKPNGTYPCWYLAHGSTHVYLDVQPPRLQLLASDGITAFLSLLCLASAAALVSTHSFATCDPARWLRACLAPREPSEVAADRNPRSALL